MKIALACQSVLLEKSLEIFLKNYITPYKQCDFVISDKKIEIEKPLFYIATDESDLNIPFSNTKLLLEIEKFFNENCLKRDKSIQIKSSEQGLKTNELEDKITKLTDEFRTNLIGIIKEYYEK